jgi:mono/diheme cytochrome c family protein
MLKSILLVCASSLLVAPPLALAGRGPQQAAQTPAATPAATPAPAQPAGDVQTTPGLGETPTAAPAVPAMAANMKNPVMKPTAESQAKAKQLYSIDCAMCHGDNGNGKTDLATSMSLTLADFTDSKVLVDHLDGELFNVIRNGKEKMPGEEKARASDTEVWNLVIYVRNLSKQPAAATAK